MPQRTWMVMWKEFIQISRDPRMLTVVVIMPVLMLLLFGYAINLDVSHVRLAVYDQDRSESSREFVGTFSRSGYFDVVAHPVSFEQVTAALDRGSAKLALVVPVTFERSLAEGGTASVQVLVDGSDSTTASTAIGYVQGCIQQYAGAVTVTALQRAGMRSEGGWAPVENRVRYWYNPELRSTRFIIPGLTAVILMLLSALLTSVTVVRERERGTIEQLIVSPVKPFELMLGKLAPYVLIAFGDVLLVMTVSLFVFHIPLKGSPVLVLLLSGVFVTASLGIGLLISTLATSQQVAMMFALMATQLPTVLLSGFIFPIHSMPRVIQVATNVIPATHFIKILRSIFLKGGGLSLLWQPALILLVIGFAMLGLSSVRFRKKL